MTNHTLLGPARQGLSEAEIHKANSWRTHPHWAVFVEAYQPNTFFRTQWLFLPPRVVTDAASDLRLLRSANSSVAVAGFIKRKIVRDKHKPKWERTLGDNHDIIADKLAADLLQYEGIGWVIRKPILLPMREDDYNGVWSPPNRVDQRSGFETPYTTLRWAENVLKRDHGITMSGRTNA